MKKLFLISIAVTGIAVPAAAGAATFSGVVVAKQAGRHALIVASKSGLVRTVHTHRLATRIGARVAVTAHHLADGTFSATRVSVWGLARKARIRGVVVRSSRGSFLLSAGHSMLAIRTRRLFSLNDTGSNPQPGSVVDVTVETNGDQLDEQDVRELGDAQQLELQGTVGSITQPTATTAGEVVLQVGTSTIHIVVPAGTTLPNTLQVGDSVQLKVALSGATFTLLNSQDESDDQGEDVGGDGGDGSGDGGGGGND
ncbi:MAG TPA: hypothetical protein VF002_01495 [Gaiellaceae bacterium]